MATNSIVAVEKWGYPGGSAHPAPMVKTVSSSMVTTIHMQSGTPWACSMMR